MTTAAANYLDPQTLAAVGALELRARLIVEGLMTGMHRSPYQGFSVEFAQHRQYAPGDDIRHLDWKVFGRTDKLYLKQYQKETNLDFVVMVDSSGSMAYSSLDERSQPPWPRAWRKFDHAASIAAAMAYLALRQQDRVGLVLFGEHSRFATRLSNSHDHWRGMVEALGNETLPAMNPRQQATALEARTTNLSRVFDELLAKLRQRSLIVLISDLFDDPAALERALARLHHQRHDLIVMQTLDPAELTFPFRTPSDFIGLEAEGRIGLDPQGLRREYLAALQRHNAAVEQTTRKFQFDFLPVDTGQALGGPLSHFLARRAAHVNRGRS